MTTYRDDPAQLTQGDRDEIEKMRRYLAQADAPDDFDIESIAGLDADLVAWAFPTIAEWWHPSLACAGTGV